MIGILICFVALVDVVVWCGVVVVIKVEVLLTVIAVVEFVARVDVLVFGGLGGVGLFDELLVGVAGVMIGFVFFEVLVVTVTVFCEDGYVVVAAVYVLYLLLVLCEVQVGVSFVICKEILRRCGLFVYGVVRVFGVLFLAIVVEQFDVHLQIFVVKELV